MLSQRNWIKNGSTVKNTKNYYSKTANVVVSV